MESDQAVPASCEDEDCAPCPVVDHTRNRDPPGEGGTSKTTHEEALPVCNICTEIVVFMGRMDCCNHLFCWEDITRWAQERNSCPWCRKTFVKLQKQEVTEGSYEMLSFTELSCTSPILEEVKVLPVSSRPGPMEMTPEEVGPNAEQARQSAAELQNWALWDMVQRQQDYERIQRRREDLRLQFASFLCRRRQELQRLEWEREKDKQFYSREERLKRKAAADALEREQEAEKQRKIQRLANKVDRQRSLTSLGDLNARLLERHRQRNAQRKSPGAPPAAPGPPPSAPCGAAEPAPKPLPSAAAPQPLPRTAAPAPAPALWPYAQKRSARPSGATPAPPPCGTPKAVPRRPAPPSPRPAGPTVGARAATGSAPAAAGGGGPEGCRSTAAPGGHNAPRPLPRATGTHAASCSSGSASPRAHATSPTGRHSASRPIVSNAASGPQRQAHTSVPGPRAAAEGHSSGPQGSDSTGQGDAGWAAGGGAVEHSGRDAAGALTLSQYIARNRGPDRGVALTAVSHDDDDDDEDPLFNPPSISI